MGAALVLAIVQAGLLFVWESMPELERQRHLLHALPDPEVGAHEVESAEKPPQEIPSDLSLAQALGGGYLVFRVLKAPEHGSVFQVEGDGFAPNVRTVQVVDGPIALGPELLQRVSDELSTPANYDLRGAKGCLPNWHVRIHFERGADTVDVLLCLHCAQMQTYRDGVRVGYVEFDPGKARFVALARDLLPNDAALRDRR